MNPFFEYLLKSTISLSLLYLLFKVFMQNDKTLVLNRFLLIGILFVSAVIPLLNFQFFQMEVPIKQMETIREFVAAPMTLMPESSVAEFSVSQPVKNEINYWLLIYGAAIFILIIRLFIAVVKVLQLIRNAEKQKLQNIVLAVVKEMIQPFTFLNHVVLSEKDLNENKKIIVAHEQAHIKQLHAIDLAVCEVFTLLHFFNPLMWLLRRDIKLNHEYQADQAVLNKGIDAQKYQLLVIQKAVGERRFALANSFSQKPILKRIKMMKKNKKRWTQIKLLLFVPVLLSLLIACARPEKILNHQEAPSSFISVTLEKDRNIIFQNRNYDYEKFEDFLKENYRWNKRKLDLSAEVKWDTAVGYQGIHKLAKILDKRGFENTDFKPFGADGKFLSSPETESNTIQKSSEQLIWSYSNLNDIGQKVTSLKVSGENGEYEKSPPINWSNVLNIIVNGENKLIINGEFTDFKKLDEIIENFVLGKQPDGRQINTLKKEIPYFGEVAVSQGIILFRLDINSSYVTIQEITEKIGDIYLELRDQKSISRFNQPYLKLNDEKRKAIEEIIPIHITTGEPKLDKENQQVVFYK